MKKSYSIRFNHTSSKTATSKSEALRLVRNEMHHTAWPSSGEKPRYIQCEDGLYCYRSAVDADADQTGASAFAVISLE